MDMKKNMMGRLKRGVQLTALFLIPTFLALEFFSFIFFYFNLGATAYVPSYWIKNHDQIDTTEAWYTEYHDWGIWHKESSKARHITVCYNYEYSSNSYGARDIERSMNRKNIVVFLGDSFVEGRAVDDKRRMTNILEEHFGTEFLNFGAIGLGPLNYEIIYKELAAKFKHDHVIVGFLPLNDFTDNDLNFWRPISNVNERYRPFYSEDGKGAIYTRKKPEERVTHPNENSWITQIGKRYFWAYGLYREVKWILLKYKFIQNMWRSNYSGYRDALDYQIKNTLGSLRRIAEEAKRNKKSFTVVLFPATRDYEAKNRGDDLRIKKIFKDFAEKTKTNYVDLIDLIDFDEKLYHTCDGHWSPHGNLMAANALIEVLPNIIAIPKN